MKLSWILRKMLFSARNTFDKICFANIPSFSSCFFLCMISLSKPNPEKCDFLHKAVPLKNALLKETISYWQKRTSLLSFLFLFDTTTYEYIKYNSYITFCCCLTTLNFSNWGFYWVHLSKGISQNSAHSKTLNSLLIASSHNFCEFNTLEISYFNRPNFVFYCLTPKYQYIFLFVSSPPQNIRLAHQKSRCVKNRIIF